MTFLSFLHFYISGGITYSTQAAITSFPFIWKDSIAYPSRQLHFGRNMFNIQWWSIKCTGYHDVEGKRGCKRNMEVCRKLHKLKKPLQFRAGEIFLYKNQLVAQKIYSPISDSNTDSTADCPVVICTSESHFNVRGISKKLISQSI